jgi:excisionase family DNA binding protein
MSAKRHIGFSPPTEETVAVFARVPVSAGQTLSRTAVELGRPKQQVIAELVERYASTLGEEVSFGRASGASHPPEVLTPEQLAGLLQIDVETVLALAAAGEIPGRRLSAEWRFSRAAVLDWLGSAEVGPHESSKPNQ